MDKETLDFVFRKLDCRVNRFQKDLLKLSELKDDTDLNQQAIEDIAFVMDLSMNALIQFKKELLAELEDSGVEYDG